MLIKSGRMTRDAAIALAESLHAAGAGVSWSVCCDVGGDASYDAWYVAIGLSY